MFYTCRLQHSFPHCCLLIHLCSSSSPSAHQGRLMKSRHAFSSPLLLLLLLPRYNSTCVSSYGRAWDVGGLRGDTASLLLLFLLCLLILRRRFLPCCGIQRRISLVCKSWNRVCSCLLFDMLFGVVVVTAVLGGQILPSRILECSSSCVVEATQSHSSSTYSFLWDVIFDYSVATHLIIQVSFSRTVDEMKVLFFSEAENFLCVCTECRIPHGVAGTWGFEKTSTLLSLSLPQYTLFENSQDLGRDLIFFSAIEDSKEMLGKNVCARGEILCTSGLEEERGINQPQAGRKKRVGGAIQKKKFKRQQTKLAISVSTVKSLLKVSLFLASTPF